MSLPFSLGSAGEGRFQLSYARALFHFVSLFLKDTFVTLNSDGSQTMPAHRVVCREKSLWLLSDVYRHWVSTVYDVHSVIRLGFMGLLGSLGLHLSPSQGNIQPLFFQGFVVSPVWRL